MQIVRPKDNKCFPLTVILPFSFGFLFFQISHLRIRLFLPCIRGFYCKYEKTPPHLCKKISFPLVKKTSFHYVKMPLWHRCKESFFLLLDVQIPDYLGDTHPDAAGKTPAHDKIVHLLSNIHYIRYLCSQLGNGTPTAHGKFCLMLLGSPPDMVHRFPLRETNSSTPLT